MDYIPLQYYEPPAIVQIVDEQNLYPEMTDYFPELLTLTNIRINSDVLYQGEALFDKYLFKDTGFTITVSDRGQQRILPIYAFYYLGDSESPHYRFYLVEWTIKPSSSLPGSLRATYLYEFELPNGLSYSTYSFFTGIEQPSIEGNDVYWLYNFGSFLASLGDKFNDLLSYEIGDYNLLTLLASGFTFYMAWCVVKFFIPL